MLQILTTLIECVDNTSVQLHHWAGIANDFYDYSPVSKTLHRIIHYVLK